jgi:hypothetical protein
LVAEFVDQCGVEVGGGRRAAGGQCGDGGGVIDDDQNSAVSAVFGGQTGVSAAAGARVGAQQQQDVGALADVVEIVDVERDVGRVGGAALVMGAVGLSGPTGAKTTVSGERPRPGQGFSDDVIGC